MLLIPLLFLLIPSNFANAAVHDLVSGQKATDLTNNVDTYAVTDNNNSTSYTRNPVGSGRYTLYVEFSQIISRNSVIELSSEIGYITTGSTFTFVDVNDNEIGSYPLIRTTKLAIPSSVVVPIKGIKIFAEYALATNRFSDLKVYYDDVLNVHVPINHVAVTNLTAVSNYNNVDLFWDNPKEIGFVGTIIKRNGVEIARLNDKAVNYTARNLQPITSYDFEVIALYSDGKTSPIESITMATSGVPADTTAPAEVTSLLFTSTHDEIQLNWVSPLDSDFSHVRIYRNNQMIESNWTMTSYTDLNLIANTSYVYRIVTVDTSGNQSGGYIQTLRTAVHVNLTPPVRPFNVTTTDGASSGRVTWARNPERDIAGYNVYLDGLKVNTVLLNSTNFVFPSLTNGQTYDVNVTAVNTSGIESAMSITSLLTPNRNGVPIFQSMYNLKDVSDSTGHWFSSIWLILAFAISIPLAFLISRRVKTLFFA